MAEDEPQSAVVPPDQHIEKPFGGTVEAALGVRSLLLQKQRAHDWRQGQRHDRRGHHRDRHRDRERAEQPADNPAHREERDRKSTRLNSSHQIISYAVFCLKKKKMTSVTLPSPLVSVR